MMIDYASACMIMQASGLAAHILGDEKRLRTSATGRVPSRGTARGSPILYRVRQIVRNLLINTVRYVEDKVSINVYTAGNAAMLQVVNNGTGVPAGLREQIFESYVNSPSGSQHPYSVGPELAVAR